MPNSRRRASTSAPNDDDRPTSPMTTAATSRPYVTANVRSKTRSDSARMSPDVVSVQLRRSGKRRVEPLAQRVDA